MPKRTSTQTSNFGVGRRENHDASPFYARFTLPRISNDDRIEKNEPKILDHIYEFDSRRMSPIKDNSVALVVTSPPYYAGKEYEQSIGQGHVPASYVEYLEMLYEVFAECARILEPGGRIAVNVANLGRKPYRSLSTDVIEILQNRLGLLLRGEILWVKGQAASGSCAWGSYGSPTNPVLRDLTERIIIASKGRFDRARTPRQREQDDLPFRATILKDDFMEFTNDIWEFAPESAHRVNHPAPFPVELPHRLIQLYTFEDDLVVDPFVGSGSTCVAALRSNRRYVGFEIDSGYAERARLRLAAEAKKRESAEENSASVPLSHNVETEQLPDAHGFQQRAVQDGRRAKELALELLEEAGFEPIDSNYRFRNGVEVNFVATDMKGQRWLVDVSGAFTSSRPGLKRTDTLWKALGKAAVIRASTNAMPLLLVTTDLPDPGTSGYLALKSTRQVLYHDAIDMFSAEGHRRLRRYARGVNRTKPIRGLMVPRQG